VRNPFRSEPEAFRLVLLSLGYFGLIIVAALINKWVGVAVFVALTLVALYFAFFRDRQEPPPRVRPTMTTSEGERRILVVANETVGGSALLDCIRQKSEGVQENVLVVSPALASPIRHWASDEDPGRAVAQERLDASLGRLREAGVSARGEIGDSDPLQAIEDALRTFGAEEIIISTHPEGKSNWLERGVVSGARERFGVPITHVVVDLAAERDEIR
jgi:hypothetical protein